MSGNAVSGRLDALWAIPGVSARLVGVVVFLGGWQVLSLFFPQSQFPGLERVAENLVVIFSNETRFDVVENFSMTIQRILVGFAVSMVVGTFVGIVMGTNRFLEDYLTTPVMTFLSFPALIWAFLGILWFGLTDYVVAVFTIVMVVTPYVVVNVWEGTKDLDQDLMQMARAFDASRRQVWREIYLPHLNPYMLATTRLALSLSWKILLVAELFGAQVGIGSVVNSYYLNFRADMIIAWALPIMVLMFGFERLLRRLEARLFAWRPELDTQEAAA
jgi:NitT/TauT family transport system permease protein